MTRKLLPVVLALGLVVLAGLVFLLNSNSSSPNQAALTPGEVSRLSPAPGPISMAPVNTSPTGATTGPVPTTQTPVPATTTPPVTATAPVSTEPPPPTPSTAPGPTPDPANPCPADRSAYTGYLKPELLNALLPQFRQPANLPAHPALYTMDLKVDPAASSYSGRLTLDFWNRSLQPMPQVILRTYPDFFRAIGAELTLGNIEVNGQPATFKERALTYQEVMPVAPIAPCSQARLAVSFQGKIPTQQRENQYAIGTFYAGQGFFALGTFYPQVAVWEKQPGAATWDWTITPVRASSDLTAATAAFYDVRLQVPEAYQLIAAGVPAGTAPGEPGFKAWRFVGGPLREFAAVGGQGFTTSPLTGKTRDNVQVKVYSVPSADPATAARQQDFSRKAMDVTIATLEEFGEVIGPYPYQQYSLVEFPLTGFNGVEWPMFTQLSQDIFRQRYTKDDEKEFGGLVYSKPGTLVVIHETLHQWWYNLVGNDQQAEPFLDEGLTEYSAYLLPELTARRKNLPAESAQAFAREWLDRLRNRVKQQDLPGIGDLKAASSAAEVSLDQAGFIYYRKVPLMYEAFRAKFGEEALYRFMKAYMQNNRYGLAHLADLRRELAAAVPGRETEVNGFIDRWLFDQKLAEDLGN